MSVGLGFQIDEGFGSGNLGCRGRSAADDGPDTRGR